MVNSQYCLRCSQMDWNVGNWNVRPGKLSNTTPTGHAHAMFGTQAVRESSRDLWWQPVPTDNNISNLNAIRNNQA